jgi:hypothetical protein
MFPEARLHNINIDKLRFVLSVSKNLHPRLLLPLFLAKCCVESGVIAENFQSSD